MCARTSAEPNPDLPKAERERLAPIFAERLVEAYGDPHAALHFKNPYQLLIGDTVGTDDRRQREQGHPALFGRYPTPADLADADGWKSKLREVDRLLSEGKEHHRDRRSIVANRREVPDTMEDSPRCRGRTQDSKHRLG
jgi:endonuclease III